MAKTFHLKVKTKGHSDIVDITENVEKALTDSKIKNGIVCVFVVGSTAAISTMEFEPRLKRDLSDVLEKIVPLEPTSLYQHPDNAASHIKATLIGPTLVVPVENGKLILGQWQQIVLLDFMTHPREREIIVQVIS